MRRARNFIDFLTDEDGVQRNEPKEIETIIVNPSGLF